MPSMSTSLRAVSVHPVYELAASRVTLPWVLGSYRPRGEMLEIGAGSGAMTARLLDTRPDLRAVVTDFDARMLARARRNVARFGERASALRADATQLPFPDGHFDLVLSCGMLHHVGDWRRAIAEAVRVLRPGGRFTGYDIIHTRPVGLAHISGPDMIRPGEMDAEFARLPVRAVTRGHSFVRFTAVRRP